MQLTYSLKTKPHAPSFAVQAVLKKVSGQQLRTWVEELAFPRHFVQEAVQNRRTRDYLGEQFSGWGYRVERHGVWDNLVAIPPDPQQELTLLAAHYDTVPASHGADDNASALAALMGCAQALHEASSTPPVAFVLFNREEDHLLGSRDFVDKSLGMLPFSIRRVHVLEMVGFASEKSGSQRVPDHLPIHLPLEGDFLGVLGNSNSREALQEVITAASSYLPGFPVIGLEVVEGLERMLPVLARSDHAPFWGKGISAVLWTDTSEFRNPYYHTPKDTSATLDYEFLSKVTQLLLASVLSRS